jgi:hypothetical protein
MSKVDASQPPQLARRNGKPPECDASAEPAMQTHRPHWLHATAVNSFLFKYLFWYFITK